MKINPSIFTFFGLQMNTSLIFRRVLQQYSTRSLNNISSRLTSSSSPKTPNEASSIDAQLKKNIDDFIKSNKIAIFIKGEPNAPSMSLYSL